MSYLANTKRYLLAHKVITGILALIILTGAYFAYASLTNTSGETRYILGTTATSTIVSSVSASGAVSVSNQVDVKPKVSGEITWVGVKAGQHVYAGQALASIDDTSAVQAVASAEASLKTSELEFQKDQASAPIDYQSSLNELATAQETLATAYTDTYNSISGTYLDLPAAASGMEDILYGHELSPGNLQQWNVDVLMNTFTADDRDSLQPFADKAKSDYETAKASYDASVLDYRTLTRASSPDAIGKILTGSIQMTTDVAQALQSELNFLGKVSDLATQNNIKLSSAATTLQTSARNDLSTVNSDLNSLLSQKKTLDSDTQAITSDTNNIALLKVGNDTGANPISLQISEANLDKQKQDLQNLKDNLADYTVVAPFSGTISAASAQVGDTASAAVATIITDQELAQLSLNEVDVAKIKLGDKATLTFDAIDGLTLTGTVAEIDTVGAVSQGVVSYTVKIAFSSQDARVKPGMTVNAAIQTGIATDVLTVPVSAVKTQGGASYVLAFTPPIPDSAVAAGGTQGVASTIAPMQIPVETGISDDTNIEITSGLAAGTQIVVRTATATTKTAAASTASRTVTTARAGAAGGFGGGGGLGGAVRGL